MGVAAREAERPRGVARRRHRDRGRSARPQRQLGSRGGLHLPDLAASVATRTSSPASGAWSRGATTSPASATDGLRLQDRLPERPLGLLPASIATSATASTPRSASSRGAAINSYQAGCTYAPRPKGSFIRQMFHELYPTLTTDLDGRWESYRVFMAPSTGGWRAATASSSTWSRRRASGEPFEIAEGVVIPPGSYHWRPLPSRAARRPPSASCRPGDVVVRRLLQGTLDQIELEAAWTPSPLVTPAERRARHRPSGAGRLRPHARRARSPPEPLARPPAQQLPAVRHRGPPLRDEHAPALDLPPAGRPVPDLQPQPARDRGPLAARLERAAGQAAVHLPALAGGPPNGRSPPWV